MSALEGVGVGPFQPLEPKIQAPRQAPGLLGCPFCEKRSESEKHPLPLMPPHIHFTEEATEAQRRRGSPRAQVGGLRSVGTRTAPYPRGLLLFLTVSLFVLASSGPVTLLPRAWALPSQRVGEGAMLLPETRVQCPRIVSADLLTLCNFENGGNKLPTLNFTVFRVTT